MEQAQQDVQKLAQDTKAKAQETAQQAFDDVKAIPPQVWGVGFGIALILSFIFHLITKQKEDPAVTTGVFFYTLIAGGLSILMRKNPLAQQFQLMIVILSVCRVFFNISAISLLVLSATPFVVNTIAAELRQRGLIPQ